MDLVDSSLPRGGRDSLRRAGRLPAHPEAVWDIGFALSGLRIDAIARGRQTSSIGRQSGQSQSSDWAANRDEPDSAAEILLVEVRYRSALVRRSPPPIVRCS